VFIEHTNGTYSTSGLPNKEKSFPPTNITCKQLEAFSFTVYKMMHIS